MRTPGLSPLDDEILSAYVDGALSQDERALLEQRLSADPALSAELADVRRTKAILRAAPELAPPRNFTLDPARYNRLPSQQRVLPIRWLRVGVALVAAILIIAFVVITRTPSTNSAGSLVALAPSASPAPVLSVPVTAASTIASAAKVAASNTLPPIPTLTPSVVLMQADAQNAVAATITLPATALRAVPTVIAPAPLALTHPPAAFASKQTPIKETPAAASMAQAVPSAPLAGIQSSSDAQSGADLFNILLALIRRLLMGVGL